MTQLERARLMQDEIVSMRRHLHQHPELSFREFETAAYAAAKLSTLGFSVRTGIAGAGVVADLGSGKTIAIRCDMDALPIVEMSRSAYASKVHGVMHACGHDAHLACTLGAAALLAEKPPPGRVRIILQPGEEETHTDGRTGAAHMIDAGVLEDVSAVIGLHVDATIPTGKVGIIAGPVMPALDRFTVSIGCQSEALSHKHPALVSARVIKAIYDRAETISSDTEPVMVTIGAIHSAGERGDVGAERVDLTGALKTFTPEKRQMMVDFIKYTCNNENSDCAIEFELLSPATINDEEISGLMKQAASDLIGNNVIAIKRRTWTVDFSLYSEAVPGAFMFLGVEIASSRRSHHSPTFDIDENALPIGAAILAQTVHQILTVPAPTR